MPSPIVPRHPNNPVGQTRRIARAYRAIRRDLDRARDLVLERLKSWPVRRTNRLTANDFFDYVIPEELLATLIAEVTQLLNSGQAVIALQRATEEAYREGTAKAYANLFEMLTAMGQSPSPVAQRISEAPILRRASIAGLRSIGQIKGLNEELATELSRILFNAVQTGENPLETAKTIRERFAVSKSRAERIARTEITGAHRIGRWDEAREQEQRIGMEVRLIHYSALIPGRTRYTHAARHGAVVTVQEQADWYSRDGNAINCLCTASEVPIDPEDGKPLFGDELLERMNSRREAFMRASRPTAKEVIREQRNRL